MLDRWRDIKFKDVLQLRNRTAKYNEGKRKKDVLTY